MGCNGDGVALCDSCNGFCAIPQAHALTWPKNIGHATSPHQAQVARFAQKTANALVLSATGNPLSEDLVVSEGHKHDSKETVIHWRQLGSWILTSTSAIGVGPVLGHVVTNTTPSPLGVFWFRLPLGSAGTVALVDAIYPRIKVSADSTGAPLKTTLFITGSIMRCLPSGIFTLVTSLPTMRIDAQDGPPLISYFKRWFTWSAVEIEETAQIAASGRLALLLSANVSTAGETATIHEVALSQREGL